MRQFIVTFVTILLTTFAFAGFPVIDGQLVDNFGDPNLATDVDFKVQVYAVGQACLLSEEDFDNGGSGFDLSSTKGSFSLALGSGSGFSSPGGTNANYTDIFSLDTSGAGNNCTTIIPAGQVREIIVSYSLDSGSTWNPIATPMVYGGAGSAATIDGHKSADLLKVSADTTQPILDQIMSVLFPAGSAPGDNTYSLVVSSGVYSLVPAAGGGDITDVVAGSGLAGGSATGSATLSLAAILPAVDGNALTNLNAGALAGTLPAIDGNALTNINSANLNGSLPAVDGNALTNLNAGALTGSLPAINGSALTGISGAIATVHGRTGAVAAVAGDYNAGQITNTAAGNIAAVTVQAALNELDTEKLALAGGNMTGTLQMNAANEIRFGDADSSNHVGFKAPATLGGDQIWVLPVADGTSGQVLQTSGAGVLSWVTPSGGTGDFLANGSVPMAGNLQLGGNTISNNGTGGLSFDAPGNATFSQVVNMDAGTNVTGSLSVAAGGNLNMGANANIIAFDGTAAVPSIKFAGATNTGLFRASGNNIGFANNGIENMRLNNSGQLGIGTSAPTSKLDVEGRITSGPIDAVAGNAGSLALKELAANGSNSVILRAPDSLADYVLTLPTDDGSANQVLKTDGSGMLSWVNDGGAANINELSDARTYGTIGNETVEIGSRSSAANYSGIRSVAIGADALLGTAGSVGAVSNVAIGWRSMESVGASPQNNIALGSESLRSLTTGDSNAAIGDQALELQTVGSNNTALGFFAGATVTTGQNNTLIGASAGDNITTGGSNIIIGHDVDASAVGVNEEINIGDLYKGDMTAANRKAHINGPLLLGNSSVACDAGNSGMIRVNGGALEVCDGSAYQVVPMGLPPTPGPVTSDCPAGFSMVGADGLSSSFCMRTTADSQVASSNFYVEGEDTCDQYTSTRGEAHMCSKRELVKACLAGSLANGDTHSSDFEGAGIIMKIAVAGGGASAGNCVLNNTQNVSGGGPYNIRCCLD